MINKEAENNDSKQEETKKQGGTDENMNNSCFGPKRRKN